MAKQTAGATLDIKKQIAHIQSTTETTRVEIDAISAVIENVNAIVATIAAAVGEQSESTRDISENIAQVSQGIQEVNENVSQEFGGGWADRPGHHHGEQLQVLKR